MRSDSLFYRSATMGKGDRRSRRGKINRGSYGKTRPKKKRKATTAPPRSS